MESLRSRCFYVGNVQTITDLAKMGLDLLRRLGQKASSARKSLGGRGMRPSSPSMPATSARTSLGSSSAPSTGKWVSTSCCSLITSQ
ncbi:MAG: hypothetical protein ACTFAL_16975 [Candidatus Electronema sp. V4]|uniref:hypothetical protein n=1 Tax=Candidatus Electronema sp. V4 TaxID=3454756 RepID=UPI00405599AD